MMMTIRNLLTAKTDSVTLAAFLIASTSLLSRLIGVLRDRILAGEFGAGDQLDVYYAAFRIPDLIFNLLILGALSAGFVPILTCLIRDPWCRFKGMFEEGNKEAWKLVNNLINILGLLLVGISLVGMIVAPGLMRLITPGFSPEKIAETAALARIMFLSPVLLGLSGIVGGALQSFRRFFVYSLSPVFYNIGIIVGALYLVPHWGIKGLAYGVVLGALLHLLVQLPTLHNLGYRYQRILDWRDKSTREIAGMMVPRTLGLAVGQLNLVVTTIVASTLASGSLAAFNFANNLQSFPVGIIGVSFSLAAFPALAVHAFQKEKLVEKFSSTLTRIFFFIAPATVLIFGLRAQLIRAVLGSGAFDWNDTVVTFEALGWFSVSLFAQAGLPLIARVFYARHDSRTPFYVGLGSAALNMLLSWILAPTMGVAGLALAFSVSSIMNFLVLMVWLRSELGFLDGRRIFRSSAAFIMAASIAAVALQGMKYLIEPHVDMARFSGIFLQGLASGGFALLAYGLILYVLKNNELMSLIGSLEKRWPWRKVETDDQGEARGI